MRSGSFGRTLACFALLAALFAALHWPVLVQGKVYANMWVFRHHAPFPKPSPESINPLNQSSDFLTHYFAYMDFVADEVGRRSIPLWNPHILCGFPMYADNQATPFSPFNLVFLQKDVFAGYPWLLAAYFLLGTALAFFYCRRYLKTTRSGALIGGIALVLCPFLAQNVDFFLLMGFVWALPLTLVAAEAGRSRGPLAEACVVATALTLITISNHSHVLLYSLFLYLTYRLFAFEDAPRRKAVSIALSLALFATLSAFLLAPRLMHLAAAQRVSSAGGEWRLGVPLWPVASLVPFQLLVPRFDEILGLATGKDVYFVPAAFIGVFPFLLNMAALPLLFSRTNRRMKYFITLNLIYYTATLVYFPGKLGKFLDFGFMRFYQVHIVATALLAASLFDRIFENAAFRATLRRAAFFSFFAVALPLAALSLLLAAFPDGAREASFHFARSHGLLKGDLYFVGRFDELFDSLRRYLAPTSRFVLVPFVVTAGIGTLLGLRRVFVPKKEPIPRVVLTILLAAELFAIGTALKPVPVKEAEAFPQTQVTDFLKSQQGLFRVMSVQAMPKPSEGPQTYVLKPNLGQLYGLDDVGGQNSAIRGDYAAFAYTALSGRPDTRGISPYVGILDFERIDPRAAGFVNVRYVLSGDEYPLEQEGLKRVFKAEGAVVYENSFAKPRFFLTTDAPGPDSAVLAEPVVERFEPDRIRLRLDAPRAGTLVYTDVYDPGWRAYVDGRERQVLRTAGLFKGVEVEGGIHEVRFEYRPRAFEVGLWLSLTVSAVLIAVLWVSGRRRNNVA